VVSTSLDTVDESEQTLRTTQENKGIGGMISDIIKTLASLFGGAMLATFLLMMCPCIVLICCACALCGAGGKDKFGKGFSKFGSDLKKVSKF
jgi:hypothetical protein